jgi:hypothetical protein
MANNARLAPVSNPDDTFVNLASLNKAAKYKSEKAHQLNKLPVHNSRINGRRRIISVFHEQNARFYQVVQLWNDWRGGSVDGTQVRSLDEKRLEEN